MVGVKTDYNRHWDEKFRSRQWGKYPPENLVRFMGRHFSGNDPRLVSVLEVGCGPGANVWFLHREGYRVSGIDISDAAIEIAAARLKQENQFLNEQQADLKIGNFTTLPWPDNSYDVVIDIFALYANTLSVIRESIGEIHRVLKPGGMLYSQVWGRQCSEYESGKRVEDGTYDDISKGPFKDMGISHFFELDEIKKVFSPLKVKAIDRLTRTDSARGDIFLEEFHCIFEKSNER